MKIFRFTPRRFTTRLILSVGLSLCINNLYAEDNALGEQTFKQQCIACHGVSAQGNQALKAPKLAGQSEWYIHNQLNSFKLGYRGKAEGDISGANMFAMAANLNEAQIASLSSYVSALSSEAAGQGMVKGNLEKGGQFYESLCGSCHGHAGKGNQALNSPKLAGLNDWYLVEQITKFRAGQRGYHSDDKLGRQMKMMSSILPDQEAINDVASFLSAQP